MIGKNFYSPSQKQKRNRQKLIGSYSNDLYAMCKASIMTLTRKAAQEFGRDGIVTNCILPVLKNDIFGNNAQRIEVIQCFLSINNLHTFFLECFHPLGRRLSICYYIIEFVKCAHFIRSLFIKLAAIT